MKQNKDEIEFENEEDKKMKALLFKIENMEFPDMFGSGELTPEEIKIRDTKKVISYVKEDRTMCKKCNHSEDEHYKEIGTRFIMFGLSGGYNTREYKKQCVVGCKCLNFTPVKTKIKVCENGVIVA